MVLLTHCKNYFELTVNLIFDDVNAMKFFQTTIQAEPFLKNCS